MTGEQASKVPAVSHPVVRRHPVTGRPSLFVSEGFTTHIEGVPQEESRRLLELLFHISTQEQFTDRHKWKDGDLLLWDNRSTIHLATGCPADQRRTLHRTTIRGEVPVPFR